MSWQGQTHLLLRMLEVPLLVSSLALSDQDLRRAQVTRVRGECNQNGLKNSLGRFKGYI